LTLPANSKSRKSQNNPVSAALKGVLKQVNFIGILGSFALTEAVPTGIMMFGFGGNGTCRMGDEERFPLRGPEE
jgi:hypothetical protein